MKAPKVRLMGSRVTIRPLRRSDLDTMSTWSEFNDPLYKLFDWPRRSSRDDDLWFAGLMRDKTRIYYAVDNERQILIGRISLRGIQGRRSARLGVGFGPDFVGQGYGTEALRVFLRHYFLDWGFDQIVLDVSAANIRAVRCYQQCGFEQVGSHYQYAGSDEDLAFLRQEPYRSLQPLFDTTGYRNLMLTYDMLLEREAWLEEYSRTQAIIDR